MATSGYLKGAFEDVPGNETNTTVLSTKTVYLPVSAFDPKLGPSLLNRDNEMRNVDEPLIQTPEAFDPSWDMDVRGYPDVLGFLFTLGMGMPTSTAGGVGTTDPDGGNVPAGANMHQWTAPYGPAGLSPKTAEFIASYAAENFWLKFRGAALDKLALDTPAQGGMGVKASGPALYLTPLVADPALTPAYESLSVPPFTRANMSIVSWLAQTAETDDVNIAMDFPAAPARTLSIASMYPDVMEKGDDPIRLTGSMPKRHIKKTDLDALMSGTTFSAKIRWLSTKVIGATAYHYSLWLEMPTCQYVEGGPEAMANKRRIGGSFNFAAVSTGAAGSSKWTLVNATTSYA